MERNFVTLHASVHPVHDVIMTGVQSLRFRQKKRHKSVPLFLAEAEGFEPPWACTQTRFKRAAL